MRSQVLQKREQGNLIWILLIFPSILLNFSEDRIDSSRENNFFRWHSLRKNNFLFLNTKLGTFHSFFNTE